MSWPNSHGLLMGFLYVALGQVAVLFYYFARRNVLRSTDFVQKGGPPPSTLADDLWGHATRPESFFLVFGYLAFVWMFKLLPSSYYDYEAPVNWLHVFAQFVVVDGFIYAMHRLEHYWPALYQRSHKAHHVWKSPRLYNAFNGILRP
jgi:sterol desaturase/sphingolipid hydroxylase (fatty acid hydroxylase superfamily)